MKRTGCLRVVDLYARSERREGSDCWWWLGAKAADGVSVRIWTVDHDRAEKKSISGPKAVFNIAQGAGTGKRWAFMRCVNSTCVNPNHVGLAIDKAEIGRHIAKHGKRKGNSTEARRANVRKAWAAQGVSPTPPAAVHAIRSAGPKVTNVELGLKHGITPSTVSMIRLNKSHKHLLEAA